ncbi:hypothetical protein ACJ41O_003553 [Fusarium nematophilum]
MAFPYEQFTILSVLGAITFYIGQVLATWRRMNGAKTPPGWPLVGNAPELASSDGNLIPIFNRWAKQYGDIVQFSLLGEKQVVLSSDNVAHELFVQRGSKYSDRETPHAMAYITRNLNPDLMPNNGKFPYISYLDMLLTRSDAWRRERKLIHSAISITSNDKYLRLMEEEGKLTLRDLIHDPRYFNKHLNRYAYGVLTRSMLGFRVNSADHPFITETDSDISDEEAGYTFSSMISGGTRSPHNALLTFLYLMMEYPEWQQKLQEQVDEVVGSERLPYFADIPVLPIVRAIVKEGIRYRSIKVELGIPHRFEQDDIYNGYVFPKDTVFHANYAAILMDKDTEAGEG